MLDFFSGLSQASLFNFVGGLILFFFGLMRTTEGMQNIAGGRLRVVFAGLIKNRLKSCLFGLTITSLTQSSAATAVLTIGFVSNGIVSLVDGIAVVLGASIGASLILQFIAFNPGWLLFPLLIISFSLLFFARQNYQRDAGAVLFGLSLLMLGLAMLTSSFEPLRDNPDFVQLISVLQENLWLSVLCSALLAALVQNSTAVIALIIALGASGHLHSASGVALILGANIGSCAPTIIAAMHGSVAARRVAAAQFLVVVSTAACLALVFPYFLRIISLLTPGDADFVVTTFEQAQWYQAAPGQKPFITRHLANANTFFAIFSVLFFLPFLQQIARLTTYLIRGRETVNEFGLQFIDYRVLNTPPIALSQARSELRRMAQTAQAAVHETKLFLADQKAERLHKLTRYENLLDLLQKELIGFLVELSHRSSSFTSAREVALMMHMVADFERIGDHCQALVRLSQRKQEWQVVFSQIAQRELDALAVDTVAFVDYIVEALDTGADDILEEAQRRENFIDRREEKMRNDHLQRLTTGECAVRPGLIYIDMVQAFEKISDHAFSVAKCLSGDKK
ncbi:MAG: Na/Pi cotransporter family protein [Desulfuromonadales bacterium]|nr:Na/Pi cotransporter family protein [Desulfuromonadales bacterium]